MEKKRFIFISPGRSQFFTSDIGSPVEGFKELKDYKLPSGGNDYQSFDNDRQDLIDQGWSEIPSPQYLVVRLYYMKESGKYYSEDQILVPRFEAEANPAKNWYDTVETVRGLVRDRKLPGLVEGSLFDVFILCEEHPNYVPTMVKYDQFS